MKAALDPAGIFNPGKIFSPEARPGRQVMAERYAAHFPGE